MRSFTSVQDDKFAKKNELRVNIYIIAKKNKESEKQAEATEISACYTNQYEFDIRIQGNKTTRPQEFRISNNPKHPFFVITKKAKQ